MQAHWIDTPDALQAALRTLPPVIGIDTEFVRERTYWPRLALVQLALGDAEAGAPVLLVDATAPGVARALAPLLADPAVTKVMHSASEDIVALQHACGAAPAPLFDTQIAAGLCGLGTGLGYQKLVDAVCGVQLDKGQTRSDWLRRPLSDDQLRYAVDDVRHLHRLHVQLSERLQALGRGDWLAEDSARLLAASGIDDEDRWPHLGLRAAQFLDAAGQRRLLRLLRWREAHARQRDLPRGWVLDNELVQLLARKPPADIEALHALLQATPKAPRQLTEAIWTALTTTVDGEDGMPVTCDDAGSRACLKAMQDAVCRIASEHDVPEAVLASRRWLQLLLDTGQWPPALAGWRHALLAPVLQPLLDAGKPPSV